MGEELFPLCEDDCVEMGPWGRKVCKYVNRAVKEGNDVSRNCYGHTTQNVHLVMRVWPLMVMAAAVLGNSWRRMDGVKDKNVSRD